MAAAEPSYNLPPPLLRRRPRRLVFDRRYGWIFDEWTEPAADALSGGRGMFCILPMAQSLMNAAVSSINYAVDSVSRARKRPEHFSPLAYLPHQALRRKQQSWFRELEHSGVIADLKCHSKWRTNGLADYAIIKNYTMRHTNSKINSNAGL